MKIRHGSAIVTGNSGSQILCAGFVANCSLKWFDTLNHLTTFTNVAEGGFVFTSCLLSVIVSVTFFIKDSNDLPIVGGWVGDNAGWLGFTDSNGYFYYSEPLPDSIIVHATGFVDWVGICTSDSIEIVLQTLVIDSENYILVTSSRGSLRKIIPSTTILDTTELLNAGTGLTSLNGKVPGITVREYGGSIPITSISIRGADPSQIDVQVEGNSIVSIRDGMATGIFDPSVFSSIEIARGGASNVNGAGSAGAINYLPPLFSQPFVCSFSAFDNAAFRASVKYHGSGMSIRKNVGSEGSVGYSSTLLSTFHFAKFRGGFLGGYAFGETEAPSWSLESNGERKQGQIEGWITRSFQPCEAQLSFGSGYMDYFQTEPFLIDDTHKDNSIRAAFSWRGPIFLKLGGSAAFVNSTATSNHSDFSGTLQLAKTTRFFASTAGCKISSSFTRHFSGRLTGKSPMIYQSFSAFCSIFSDFRDPTINDMYWPSDGFSSGNPLLNSERSTGCDVGVSFENRCFQFNFLGFATKSKNLIMWLPNASGIWTPSNISSSFSRGLELNCSAVSDIGSINASATWNISTDETTGSVREGMLLPYRPEYLWGVSADLVLLSNLKAAFSLTGIGKRFSDRTQTQALDEYNLLNFSLKYDLHSNLNIEMGVNNLTNTIYEETNGYNGIGRTYHLATTFMRE